VRDWNVIDSPDQLSSTESSESDAHETDSIVRKLGFVRVRVGGHETVT
jgi:hypothetical protein